MRFEYSYLLLLEVLSPIIFIFTLLFFNRKRKLLGKRFNLELIDNYIEIDLKSKTSITVYFYLSHYFLLFYPWQGHNLVIKRLLLINH